MIQTSLAPIATLQDCPIDEANELLTRWGHRMGPIIRGNKRSTSAGRAYLLLHELRPIAVAVHSTLIRDRVGGGLAHITRANGIELARLCAERPGLCRVMLRLWRELVFPALGYQYAISYQDADLHSGATYRFDGWKRSPALSRSGTDARSGMKGRRKWVWWWERAV